jgi:sporulation protein YlmC with PRC-barrel domain
MKTKFSIAAAVAAALLLLPAASAQQTNTNNNQGKLLSASELKGSDVRNLQNEDIGDIDEVLIDSSSGKVRYVVLGVGGFLGLGETHVAVPWEAVRVTHEGNTARYVVDASKERLEKAPRLEGRKFDRLYVRESAEPTYTYWGVTWYDVAPATGASPGASPAAKTSPSPGARTSPSPAVAPAPATGTTPARGSSPAAGTTPTPTPRP